MINEDQPLNPAPKTAQIRAKLGALLSKAPQSWWARALIIVLLVVPVMVSATYMWIMWDPTNYLKQVPVAVSTEDDGATADGKYSNLGQEILDSLTNTGQLDFHKVSGAEAVRGLEENRYAFSLVIPKDFSKKILTVTDRDPQKARINVYYNDYNGTLGSTVAGSVIDAAQREITATIGEAYAKEVFVGIGQLGDGLREAASGAKELDGGAGELQDGTGELHSGVAELVDGIGQLHDGTGQLSSGTNDLVGGTLQLGDGARQISDGVSEIATPIQELLAEIKQSTTGLLDILQGLKNSSIPDISENASQLLAVLDELDLQNPNSVAGQISQLKEGTAELSRQLNDPTAEYLSGVIELNKGAGELHKGVGELQDGGNQLLSGTEQLKAGVTQLKDGTGQLSSGLSDGANQAPVIASPDKSAQQVAVPFTINTVNQNPSQVVIDGDMANKEIARGSGPVIIILGAFLLALILWSLLNPIGNQQKINEGRQTLLPLFRRVLGGIFAGIVISLAVTFAAKAVGWSPGSWFSMTLVILLIGTTAVVTTHFFTVLFGKLIGVIAAFTFFMFQIFVFGGIFPPGTIPPAFRIFKDISPMTYARSALMRADIQLYDNMFWTAVGMLILMSLLAVGGSALVRWARHAAHNEGLIANESRT